MNEDIKSGLDAQLPAGRVPLSLDTDKAVALGRRSRKRRMLAAVGGSVLSVVAVTGLVMALLAPSGLFSGNHGNAAAGDDLPELDPELSYEWLSGGSLWEDTSSSTSYTKAFWDHWNTEQPEAEPDYKQYHLENQPTVTPKHPAEFALNQRELTEWSDGNGDTIYQHPVLSVHVDYDDGQAGGSGQMAFQFGDKMPNFIDVEIIPAGQFRIGTDDVYDLAWCGGNEDGDAFTDACEVTRATGPDGERIDNVVTDETRVEDDARTGASHKSIVYRADGSAVVVSDSIRGWHGGSGGDEGKNIGDMKPALSFEELTAIALALPEKPLE